tara:strand:- start:347 stop:634 length:288 start_codon:yes stop_codon:yes gene_type:complete
MIKKFENIFIQKDDELEKIKKKITNNNSIIQFEDDTAINIEILDFFNLFKNIHKKSLVIVSKTLKNNNYLFSIVPTFQEAIDIIEIEEIERLLNE